ncbi:MAG TPA: hypothetical protein PK869_06865 [Candidatus Hydrogenedentes bacterium]|nr:hypothetical protein [Candidatus Hydrogenedentota bacterium]
MSSDFTRPEREFRVGAVRVTVWGNPRYGSDGKTWVSHRVAMDRGYKDHDGNWKKADTLETDDIPKAIMALKRAYEYLTMNKQANATDTPNMNDAPLTIDRVP